MTLAASRGPAGRILLYVRTLRSKLEQLAAVLSGTVVARAAAFVTSIIIARDAGAHTFGEFAFFTAIFVLVSEAANALDICYLRRFSRRNDGRLDSMDRTIHVLSKMAYCAVVTGTMWICAGYAANQIFDKPGIESLIRTAALSGGLLAIFSAIAAWFQARRRFLFMAALLPVFNVLVLLAAFAGVLLGTEISQEWLSYVYLSLSTVLASIAVVALARTGARLDLAQSHIGEFLRSGLALLGANALAMTATRLDLLLLPHFLAFEEVGRYGVALRIAVVLSLVQSSVTALVLPAAASALADYRKLKRYFAGVGLFCLVQVAAALLLISLSHPIIAVLFGIEYVDVQGTAVVLIVQALLTSFSIPLQGLIQCGDRPHHMIYLSILRLILAFGLLVALVPDGGMLGAAYAMTSASAVYLLAMLAVVIATPAIRAPFRRVSQVSRETGQSGIQE